jgi:hypothetical protein
LSGWDRVGKEMRPHWHVACIIELSLSEVTELWGWPKRISIKRIVEIQSHDCGQPFAERLPTVLLSPRSELGITEWLANFFVTISTAMHSSRRGRPERQPVT